MESGQGGGEGRQVARGRGNDIGVWDKIEGCPSKDLQDYAVCPLLLVPGEKRSPSGILEDLANTLSCSC